MPTLKHPHTPLNMCDSQDDKLSLFQESPIPPPELSFLSRLFVASCIKAHQCIVSMGLSNTVEGSQFPNLNYLNLIFIQTLPKHLIVSFQIAP
jgi:hypothetical protein